jgi:hypothetical protein
MKTAKPTTSGTRAAIKKQQKELLRSIFAQGESGYFEIKEFFHLLHSGDQLDFILNINEIELDQKINNMQIAKLKKAFDKCTFSPLTLAAFNGNVALCDQLIKLGASPDFCGPEMTTNRLLVAPKPLQPFFCALEGRKISAAILIAKSVDFERYTPDCMGRYSTLIAMTPELNKFVKQDALLTAPSLMAPLTDEKPVLLSHQQKLEHASRIQSDYEQFQYNTGRLLGRWTHLVKKDMSTPDASSTLPKPSL